MESLSLEAKVESGYRIALEHAGWAELEIGVIRASGRDRVSWLHKIITADIEHLGPGQGTHAALLDAKGHFIADFTALMEQDSILLLAEPTATGPLLDSLRRYIIREKVQLNNESGMWGLFTLIGKVSDDVTAQSFHQRAPETPYSFTLAAFDPCEVALVRAERAHVPVTDVLVPSAARERVRGALNGIPELSPEVLEVLRIEAGVPRWGIDFDAATLVLEIPNVLAVRVDQGCYVGQEVVARLVHRGHVNRMLMGLKFEGGERPTRGDVLHAGGKEVGSVTSAANSPRFGMIGLGYVHREASEIGTRLQLGNHLRALVVKIPFEE